MPLEKEKAPVYNRFGRFGWHMEESCYYDCGGNLYFFPYTGPALLKRLNEFCEAHPRKKVVTGLPKSSFRAENQEFGPGYIIWIEDEKGEKLNPR